MTTPGITARLFDLGGRPDLPPILPASKTEQRSGAPRDCPVKVITRLIISFASRPDGMVEQESVIWCKDKLAHVAPVVVS